MTYHQPGAAGTAGAGYRCPPPEHPYTPERADYGRRPICGTCHREHVPEPRRGA